MRKLGNFKKSMLGLCALSVFLLIAGFAALSLSPSAPPEQAALEAASKFADGPVGILRESATVSGGNVPALSGDLRRVSDGKRVWLVQLRKSGSVWEAVSVIEIGALE